MMQSSNQAAMAAYRWTEVQEMWWRNWGQFGQTWTEKVWRTFEAWQRQQLADLEYHVMLIDAWGQFWGRYQQEVTGLVSRGDNIPSSGELVERWLSTYDEVIHDIVHSERYVVAQGEMTRATMAYRMKQREMVDMILNAYDVPTRTDVDDLRRNFLEQRRELGCINKTLAELSDSVKALSKNGYSRPPQALDEAQATITALQAEVASLQTSLAEVQARADQVDDLRRELEALRQLVKAPAA
jgi:hypothetical protein